MSTQKSQPKREWLDDGIKHLQSLFQEASDFADEGDAIPSEQALAAAVQVLQTFRHADAPKMGLTANGEFALTWESTSNKLRAYVKHDGSVQYFCDKTLVNSLSFGELLATGPTQQSRGTKELS